MLRHIDARDARLLKQRREQQRKKEEKRAEKRAEKPPPEKKRRTHPHQTDEPVAAATRCTKYRIHPTAEQRKTLATWMDAARWVYNRATEKLNEATAERKAATMALLREWGSTETEAWRKSAPERFWDVPYEVRDSPLRDIAAACTSLRAKEKRMKRKLKFRRRKDDVSSLTLRSRNLNCKTARGVWPLLFGTVHDRSVMRCEDCGNKKRHKARRPPLVFEHDCRLLYERKTRFFYLCVPTTVAVAPPANVPDTQGDAASAAPDAPRCGGKVVAIDPGLRTFGTCYDPSGAITEWASGGGHLVVLYRLNRKASRLERRAAGTSGRHSRRLAAVAARLRKRATDLVNELHRSFARWLCLNHDLVLLPKFSTRSIVRKRDERTGRWKRKIGKKSAGSAMRLAHYKFRNVLIHKAAEFGTRVEICDEQYTSKTCGVCGTLNEGLGASKTFECKACGCVADRDHNAARNILIRYLAVNDVDLEGAKTPVGELLPG